MKELNIQQLMIILHIAILTVLENLGGYYYLQWLIVLLLPFYVMIIGILTGAGECEFYVIFSNYEWEEITEMLMQQDA